MHTCAELFKNLLDSKGFGSAVRESQSGATILDFPYSGKIIRCIFNGEDGTYLSLYCQFEKVPEAKVADIIFLCNSLNSKYKWVKLYVDESNDLMIQDDAILSVENAADEALELLVRLIDIADEIKPDVMRAIYA